MIDKYGIQPCTCGSPHCSDYWLTGIGKFVQGSGFTRDEAERIKRLLNQEGRRRHTTKKSQSNTEPF